jgi:hypothetical protein
MCCGIP